ncbi:MAG: hypothetical protein VB012_01940 [Erysipelotrichaceae bacterium]|nr:hypothetical protein [Erysipelotrichaceae bacterium]
MMLICCSVSLPYLKIGLQYLEMLKDEDKLSERIQLEQQAIKRINNEFYNFDNENFTISIFESIVTVVYDELTAQIKVSGRHNFQSCLLYNDPYGTIDEYYYSDICTED